MTKPSDAHAALARWGAETIRNAFDAYQRDFRRIAVRARERFERRDWRGTQQAARDRLEIRSRMVASAVAELRYHLGEAARERPLWEALKAAYSTAIAKHPDIELAETFLNSVTRRLFATVGVNPRIEFVDSEVQPPAPDPARPIYRTYRRRDDTAALLADVLNDAASFTWADLRREARLAAGILDAYLRVGEVPRPYDSLEILEPVFYRGKGAYVVGRIWRGSLVTPLVLALLHEADGVRVDALLLTLDEASIVFSFTRSYFSVDADRPHDVIAFLQSIMPNKRVSELYTALGYNKHGKTELYRELARHLSHTQDLFAPAPGAKGMVMAVFTLPSLDIVFKVIKDRFPPPKSTTRQEVMSKYSLVFSHDRAGRLVDAQEFEHLTFDLARFRPELVAELQETCGETVRIHGDAVAFDHVYVERRVAPLDLYIREADQRSAREAILDFGQAIRDLAATNTFPGDMLLKNFGVTRTGRVIFYDYDELCLLTDCKFRDIPTPRYGDDETASEPTFYVGENDIFPEEFLPFLGLPDFLREPFLEAHGELLTAAFWRRIQERLHAGEIVDIFPYKLSQRLRHLDGDRAAPRLA